jgi:putative membrane protein
MGPGLFIRWLILTFAILITAYLMDGIQTSGFLAAFFAAAILAVLNAVLRPILLILTLPINVISLGLFTFVINAMLLSFVSALIPGFEVNGFWSAVFGSLLISIAGGVITSFIDRRGRVHFISINKDLDDNWRNRH